VRELADLELDGSLQHVTEVWGEKTEEERETTAKAIENARQMIHARIHQAQAHVMKHNFDSLTKYDAAQEANYVNDFASEFEPKIARLGVDVDDMKDRFQVAIQDRFDKITGVLLTSRKDLTLTLTLTLIGGLIRSLVFSSPVETLTLTLIGGLIRSLGFSSPVERNVCV